MRLRVINSALTVEIGVFTATIDMVVDINVAADINGYQIADVYPLHLLPIRCRTTPALAPPQLVAILPAWQAETDFAGGSDIPDRTR